jgi:hypothetical protein
MAALHLVAAMHPHLKPAPAGSRLHTTHGPLLCPQLPLGRELVTSGPPLLGFLAMQLGAWRLPVAAAVARALAALVAGAAACVVVDARARLAFQQQRRRQRLVGACAQQGGKAKAE